MNKQTQSTKESILRQLTTLRDGTLAFRVPGAPKNR
jgi:hypothetical protein